MKLLRLKALLKVIGIFILIISYITITTNFLKTNLIYQVTTLMVLSLYYIIFNRNGLKNLFSFFWFLCVMITLLHLILFIYKTVSNDLNYSLAFYKERWLSIAIRVFIFPNIFAFVDILTSKISFIDIILISKKNRTAKAIYILLISGIEVMERLRVHFEYHPLNMYSKGFRKIPHYLAVPLTLFFGIYRGFEKKYNIMLQREKILKER